MKVRTPKNAKTNGEGGFTLIETAITMVVMMVGALGCSSLFLFSMQNNVGGSERALSMAVAQQQLEQIRSVSYEDATLTAGTTNLTVTSGGRDYAVQRVVENQTNSDGSAKELKKITITVTSQSGGPNWTRTPVVLVTFRSTLASGSYVLSE